MVEYCHDFIPKDHGKQPLHYGDFMNKYNSSAASSYLHSHLQDELDDYSGDNAWVLARTEMDNGSTWYDFVHPTWGMASVQEVGTGFSCETEVDTLLEHRDHAATAWTANCQKVVEAVRELRSKTSGNVFYTSMNSVAQSALVAQIEHQLWAHTRIHLSEFEVNSMEDSPTSVAFELNSSHPYSREIFDVLVSKITGNSHSIGHGVPVTLGNNPNTPNNPIVDSLLNSLMEQSTQNSHPNNCVRFSIPLNGNTLRDTLTNFIAKGATWDIEKCASVNQIAPDLTFFTEATMSYNSNKAANAYDATVFLNGLQKYTGNINALFTALEGSEKWPWLAKAVVKKLQPAVDMDYFYEEYDMDMQAGTHVTLDMGWPQELCAQYSRIFNAAGEDAQLFTCEAGAISPHQTYQGTIEEWTEQLEQYGFTYEYDATEYDDDEDDNAIHGSKAYGDQVLMSEAIKSDKYTAITKLLNKNAVEVSQGLQNGSFLVDAILANNLDAIEAFMNANATVNDKVVAALIQKMHKFEAFVQPVLEKSQSLELLTACVNWQMGLNPTGVNPRQRDWIFNAWKNHPNKDDILVEAATNSDSAWRVSPWKTELQSLASSSPQLFFKSINKAVHAKKYNFVRETVRALKIPPSQIAMGSSNLLAFAQNLKATIKAGGKIATHGYPPKFTANDIVNNPALFAMGQRPATRQVDPTESFVQAVTIMEAQFAPKPSIKRGP